MEDYNVIAVNWSNAADVLNYYRSRQCIKVVAQEVAELIAHLVVKGLNEAHLELAGHSLGSDAMGLGQ